MFEYHRAQVRKFLGFRERTMTDAEKLTARVVGRIPAGVAPPG